MAQPLCSWILPKLGIYTNFNDNYFPVMPTIILLCTGGISLPVQSDEVLIFASALCPAHVHSNKRKKKKISASIFRLSDYYCIVVALFTNYSISFSQGRISSVHVLYKCLQLLQFLLKYLSS